MRSAVGAAVGAVAFLLLPASAYATVTVSFTSPTATVTMGAGSDSTTIADATAAGDIAISNVPALPAGCTPDPSPNTVDCPATAVHVNAAGTNPANLSVTLLGLTRASATVSLGNGSPETLTAAGALTKAFSYTSGVGSPGVNTVDLSGVTGGLPGGANIATLGSGNDVKLPTTQGNLSVVMGAGPGNTLDFGSDTADASPVTFTYTGARALRTSATASFSGVDTLIGTGGTLDDTFVAGTAGNGDTLEGGGGTNRLDLTGAAGAVDVNLQAHTVTGAQSLTIANFQNVTAPNANGNTIVAGTGGTDETLNGGSGTGNTISYAGITDPFKIDLFHSKATDLSRTRVDTITGFQNATASDANGNTIVAGLGDEVLNGGSGADNTISYSGFPDPVRINLANGTETDLKSGSTQGDTITGFQNAVGSPTGNNTVIAGLGNETLNGGGGTNNTVSFAAFTTPVTVDLAHGTETSTGGQHDTLIDFQFATGQAPEISSASSATFTTGQAGSFTVTGTGAPTPSLSESGALPRGVSFIDGGDGTATLAGTPTAGAGGRYTISITASNGISPDATQTFTLTVDQSPAITSASSATFTAEQAGSFIVTGTGSPTPSLSESGALPSGVSFTDNGGGTAVLAGTPAAGTGGRYTISIRAANGISPDATQSFTLTVNAPTPDLSRLRVSPRAFQAATRGGAIIAKVENGTSITYRDSLAASTTFRVYRELPGSSHGRKCVPLPRGNHRGKSKRCTRLVLVGSFTHHDKLGINRLRFTGRLRGRALSPGSYELDATAKLDGQHSRTISTSFAILVPPPACQDRDHDGDCDAPGQS